MYPDQLGTNLNKGPANAREISTIMCIQMHPWGDRKHTELVLEGRDSVMVSSKPSVKPSTNQRADT